jgi:hypothetical protein
LRNPETHALQAVAHLEGDDLGVPCCDGLPEGEGAPAEGSPSKSSLHTGHGKRQELPQRLQRLGCGVDTEGGFGEERKGGRQGASPPEW